jgi:hypothetical protein
MNVYRVIARGFDTNYYLVAAESAEQAIEIVFYGTLLFGIDPDECYQIKGLVYDGSIGIIDQE